ncbi:putative glucan endo-1,3-beta-glucosidase eglC [Metarhizium anisopliae]
MPSRLLSLATAVSGAAAAFQGFNYGSTFTDGRPKAQTDFENEFKTAAGLEGTNGGFTSARLYTMVQAGTGNDVISAIPAAISTKTSLLLGLWASAGQASFNNELAALKKTIDQYCGQLDGLIAGISVGSEDLYRISPTGQAASPDPGASPTQLVNYIKEVRDTIKGSCLETAPIGHVDTWTAYVNETNKPVIDAIDWVGMDAYPYYENTKPNGIENAAKLFQAAIDNTQGASGGKPIWITETGWPVSGPKEASAVPGVEEAQTFWREVGCPRFGNVNVWWFTLQDGAPTIPSPAFGVIGSTLTTKPLYDLSCDKKQPTSSKAAQSSQTSAQSQAPTATGPAGTSVQGSTVQQTTLSAFAGVAVGAVMAVAAL